MKRLAALLPVAFLAACGPAPIAAGPGQVTPSPATASAERSTPTQSPGSSAQATPAAAPSPGLLFAVLEGGPQPSTVAIVGLDGYAKAKATFQPRQRPYIGNAAVPMQAVAQVVGAGVYYIDGYGTVRNLRVNAPPQIIGTFPQQPGQFETWFAVSPDGSRVLAGILQFPAVGPTPSGCSGFSCMPPLIGPTKFDLMSAQAGLQPMLLQHLESSQLTETGGANWAPSFPVGWIPDGAVVMEPVGIATQNAWWGGALYVINASGKEVWRSSYRQIGGSDCDSASVTTAQFIACTSGKYAVTVRTPSGDIIWSSHVDGFNALSLFLSPDGQGISDGRQVETRTRGLVPMPTGFNVQGWLDNNTVAGRPRGETGPDQGNLSWISLSDPAIVHDLGFKGDFAGTLGS